MRRLLLSGLMVLAFSVTAFAGVDVSKLQLPGDITQAQADTVIKGALAKAKEQGVPMNIAVWQMVASANSEGLDTPRSMRLTCDRSISAAKARFICESLAACRWRLTLWPRASVTEFGRSRAEPSTPGSTAGVLGSVFMPQGCRSAASEAT